MKEVMLSIAVVMAIGITSCYGQNKTETVTTTEVANEMALTDLSFGVRGNCGMCKSTIEKAANSIEGVAHAIWDKDKKKIDVSFDATKTNAMAIENAVAAAGYDTENVVGNEKAYKSLMGCCQYDHEMDMNQSGEKQEDDHKHHDH